MQIHKIMLVDDEADIRTIGEISLAQVGGWETLLAPSGTDALLIAAQEKPDVILLDVMMPGTDGPATLEQLKAAPATASIPVIFLTAKVQPHEVARYLDLGAAGTIAKPFDPMTLPQQVRKIVQASQ